MDRRFELALGHFETALKRFEEVLAPAKYMSHKQLLEHGIDFAQLPFALYRET